MNLSWILVGARNAGGKTLESAAAVVVNGVTLLGVIFVGQKLYKYFLNLQEKLQMLEKRTSDDRESLAKEVGKLNEENEVLKAEIKLLADKINAQNNLIEPNIEQISILEKSVEEVRTLVAENKPYENIQRQFEQLSETVVRLRTNQEEFSVTMPEDQRRVPAIRRNQ